MTLFAKKNEIKLNKTIAADNHFIARCNEIPDDFIAANS